MKKDFGLFLILAILFVPAIAQDVVPLFASKEPLSLQASGSIKSIKKENK